MLGGAEKWAFLISTFCNCKGGIDTTSLVYHLSWIACPTWATIYLACDLDPLANLTAAFLDEDYLETLWNNGSDGSARAILQ